MHFNPFFYKNNEKKSKTHLFTMLAGQDVDDWPEKGEDQMKEGAGA